MIDFTPTAYRALLRALSHRDRLTLRHDVDRAPDRSLALAHLEAEEGYRATYYFRTREIASRHHAISDISALGHRIGYHYECLTTSRGDLAAAYDDFRHNLDALRQLAEVSTACAHGSPRSPWDSQELWNHYDIHALGIDYEPMLDTDFSRTLYLTDTGRRWDGFAVAVRDKVSAQQTSWEQEGLRFHRTADIIRALGQPDHPIHRHPLLVNTHPQRWLPLGPAWLAEATAQPLKNLAKGLLIRKQN